MWMKFLTTGVSKVFLDRVWLAGGDHIPAKGPVLFLGLHRNGAFDGIAYGAAIPGAITHTFSVQLHGNWLMRQVLRGITLKRAKDAGPADHNAASLDAIKDELRRGGRVFCYPEGTSTLGPAPLDFKKGISWLVSECWREGIPLRVIPMGVRYNTPTDFRPEAHVTAGPALTTADVADTQASTVHDAIGARLLEQAVIANDYAEQQVMQAAAGLEAGFRDYPASLKAARNLPDIVKRQALDFMDIADAVGLWFHRGFPRFSRLRSVPLALKTALLSIPVGLGFLANLVPALASAAAPSLLADDQNVINFWRSLVGTVLLALWIGFIAGISALSGTLLLPLAYAISTAAGLTFYTQWHRNICALWNRLRAPSMRREALALQKAMRPC